MPLPIKELDNGDPNRPRSPEIFLGGPGIKTDSLNNSEKLFETNLMEASAEEDTNIPEKMNDENTEEKPASSEDSEEDSDDDIVVAAGNFTLSSMENNMVSQQNNANSSTAGINLKRNNLLTLTNVPGVSTGNKVNTIILCIYLI